MFYSSRDPQMTDQDLFDTMVRNMIQQGAPAFYKGMCFYRFQGRCCVIGSLIPPDRYDGSMEGMDPLELAEQGVIPVAQREELYTYMQAAHDAAARNDGNWLNGFLRRAKQAAKRFGLDATVCEVRV